MFAKAAVGAALVLLLAGLSAGQQPTPQAGRAQKSAKKPNCVFVGKIDSWKYLDPYHVIIYGPTRSQAYLLDLGNYCQALQSAEALGTSAVQPGRLCAQRDELIVRGRRCRINSIQRYKEAEKGR